MPVHYVEQLLVRLGKGISWGAVASAARLWIFAAKGL